MKIVLDARWIFPELSGIGAYTWALIQALAACDQENQYVLLFQDAAVMQRVEASFPAGLPANMTTTHVPYGIFAPVNQVRLPSLLKRLEADIFHSTNYMIPFMAFPRRRPGSIRCVTTIHDVIPLIFPHHAPQSLKSRLFPLYVRVMLEAGLRSDGIITDSESSARDIRHHLRMDSERTDRVRSIPCGVSPAYRPPGDREATGDGAPKKILYVGRSDPYKNLTILIEAFAQARREMPVPPQLIVAGSPDPRYPEGPARARELGIDDAVTWTGYLTDEALVRAYQDADLLVHPSQYEGFGLPVLEAMACGTPVICSNASSLPEVAGDAAILLAPDDTQGYSHHMVAVLTDPELSASLARRGLDQARKFSWQATARATLAVYRDVMEMQP